MSKEHRYYSPTVRAIMEEADHAPELGSRRKPPSRSTFGATLLVAIIIGVNTFLLGLVLFR